MMSHEIRTPINGIIGTTDLLGDTKLTGRQKEYTNIIEKSAQTLIELINDILDFSKIEAEKLKLENIEFNLTSYILDVIDMLQINVEQKGLPLFFKNGIVGDINVTGDPVRIKQIIINLVSNAIKFTDNGSITVHLTSQPCPNHHDKEIISIKVVDTGIGIPQNRQETIFESFSQADSTTTRKYGGTGLGLTICQKLVQMMGGEIGVESIEGQGSTFFINIPMTVNKNVQLVENTIKKPDTTSIIDTDNLPPILLVEDNETNILISSQMLIQSGYEVTLCRDGVEAVEAYKNNPLPIILMDCQMPNMNGWDATRAIRKHEKENNMDPAYVLALTADAMQGDREKCIDAGMNDYMSKPFKKKQLIDKLDEIIKDV